jgi:hypothetical protein
MGPQTNFFLRYMCNPSCYLSIPCHLRLKNLYLIGYTGKPRFNESEGTKDFVLYSRGFVINGTFYYRINYKET